MRITPHRLAGHLLCLALSSLATAASVHAATRCVAPGGAYGCLSSINIAISASAAGDVVVITDGHYAENVVIDKPLTLTGTGGGAVLMPAVSNPNPCPGEGSLCAGASNIILVQASNVVIRNLTLDGDNPALTSGVVRDGADLDARNGIITNHHAGVYNDLTVTNVTVQNIYLRGIYASSGGTFTFDRNTVRNVQGEYASIAMFNVGGSGRMTRNTVSKANDAISSNWSAGVEFVGNTITESASGVHTDNSSGGDLIADNRVSRGNALTSGSATYGIWTFVAYAPVTVRGNRIDDVDVGLAVFGQAPGLASPAGTTFTDNVVRGRNTAGSVGAWVTTDQFGFGSNTVAASFSNNVVSGFSDGLLMQSDPGNTISVRATCNDVRGNVRAAASMGAYQPDAAGHQDISLALNNLAGTGTGFANLAAGTIDAQRNWWGCAAGPGGRGCSSVSGDIDVRFWLEHAPQCAVGRGRLDGDR